MTPSEATADYSAFVKTLVKPGQAILSTLTPEKVDAWYAATGVVGEAGELIDAIKKFVVYNKELDLLNVIEELGDLEFYMEQIRQNLSITRDQTLAANVNKLFKRYKNAVYSDVAAHARADKVAEVTEVQGIVDALGSKSKSSVAEYAASLNASITPPPTTIILPTIGRVVWYYATPNQTQPYPGLISYVHSDRLINIGGFDSQGFNFAKQSVILLQEGEVPPPIGAYTTWMPYQVKAQKRQNEE